MQTCYNCGKEVSDETLICPDCGALVRRYNTPITPPPADGSAIPFSPFVPDPPAQQAQPLRLQGGVRVWLILLIVSSAYLAFSSLCATVLAANTELLTQMLETPGMEAYQTMMQELLPLLPQALPLFGVLTVLYIGKLVCHCWLLRSVRRLPFLISIGISAAALVCLALMGGSLVGILSFFDPLLTWLGLRLVWPVMRK